MKNMNYDELLELDGTVITDELFEDLEENELITCVECLGASGKYPNHKWYDVQIKHPQWDDEITSIDLYI